MKNFPPDMDWVASALPAKDSLVTNIIEKMFIPSAQEDGCISCNYE